MTPSIGIATQPNIAISKIAISKSVIYLITTINK